jgi:hypothetical protein
VSTLVSDYFAKSPFKFLESTRSPLLASHHATLARRSRSLLSPSPPPPHLHPLLRAPFTQPSLHAARDPAAATRVSPPSLLHLLRQRIRHVGVELLRYLRIPPNHVVAATHHCYHLSPLYWTYSGIKFVQFHRYASNHLRPTQSIKSLTSMRGLLFSTSPCVVPGSRLADLGFGL